MINRILQKKIEGKIKTGKITKLLLVKKIIERREQKVILDSDVDKIKIIKPQITKNNITIAINIFNN